MVRATQMLVVAVALAGAFDARADGSFDQADCSVLRGWAANPADKSNAIDVKLTFDGAAADPGIVQHPVLADIHRDDLCATVGCEHGFATTVPLTLLDGLEHTVHAYESDGADGVGAELGMSPKKFTCALELPGGVKRKVPGDDAMVAWHFSPFWDEISVSKGVLDAYTDGAPLPATPGLVHTASDPTALFVADVTRGSTAIHRPVGDALVAAAWDFHPTQAATIEAAALASTPEAAPLRARPFVLRGPDGSLYLVDDDLTAGGTGGAGGSGGEAPSDGSCSCGVAGAPANAPAWIAAFVALTALRRSGKSSRRGPRSRSSTR
jgi:MYXO-CTERM domain-containing protein